MMRRTVLAVAWMGLASQALVAKEADDRIGLGFEYGYHFQWGNDSRLNGRAQSFAFYLPVLEGWSAGYYHESGIYEAHQDGGKTIVDDMVQELRLRVTVWGVPHQELNLIAGFGIASYRRGDDEEVQGTVADIGAQVVAYRGATKVMTGQVAFDAIYRHTNIAELEVWPAGGGGVGPPGADRFATDDFGGFQIGFSVGIYF